MPVHYPSSSSCKSRKSMGFSIDDLIKTDQTLPTARPSSSSPSAAAPVAAHLISMPWIPPTPNHLYHLQRHPFFDYFRSTHPYSHPEVATTALFLNSFRKPKRNRTAFTPAQLLKLEDAFEKNHYIVGEERKELARHLNLSETKVKVWYQNRRTKQKRLVSEDTNSSNHQDGSQTSDSTTTKQDNEDDQESEWNHDDTSDEQLDLEHSNEKHP